MRAALSVPAILGLLIGCRGEPGVFVDIVSPARGGAYEREPVPIAVDTERPVRFTLDGAPLASTVLPIPDLAEGWHVLTAVIVGEGVEPTRAFFAVDRTPPTLKLLAPLVARPAHRRVDVNVQVGDAHRVRGVEALGAPLARPEVISCGNISASEVRAPEPDQDVWSQKLFVAEEAALTVTARDSLGHTATATWPIGRSMFVWSIAFDAVPLEAIPDAATLYAPEFILRARTADGHTVARGVGAEGATDPWDWPGEVMLLLPTSGGPQAVVQDPRTGEVSLIRHPALPPIVLPGMPLRASAVDEHRVSLRYRDREEWRDARGDTVATSFSPTALDDSADRDPEPNGEPCLPGAVRSLAREGGTLAIADTPPRARFCPGDARPPFDERLTALATVDAVTPIADGALVHGADATGAGRLIRLRP